MDRRQEERHRAKQKERDTVDNLKTNESTKDEIGTGENIGITIYTIFTTVSLCRYCRELYVQRTRIDDPNKK